MGEGNARLWPGADISATKRFTKPDDLLRLRGGRAAGSPLMSRSSPVPLFEEVPRIGPASFTLREFRLPAFTYPWHRHPEVELTWIIRGSGFRYVGDSVEPFQEGDFCLLGPNLPHAWLSAKSSPDTDVCSLVVHFDREHLVAPWLHLPELAGVGPLLDRAARGLRFDERLGVALREKLVSRPTSALRLTSLVEILVELSTTTPVQTLTAAPWSTQDVMRGDRRLARVLNYLNEHANESIQQAEVARAVRLSPSAFSRFFQKHMGRTFQSYLTEVRLSRACRQLIETNLTVSEIAFASGFGNLSNFNRSFRLRRGMSPTEYRIGSRGAGG